MVENRSRSMFFLCAVLCAVFAAIAWTAVSGKSATWDEPSHAATGWLMLWRGDYRLSPDVPPLWEYWIATPMGQNALHFDADSPQYKNWRVKHDLFKWAVQTLYQTPGNDGIALVTRGRFMALILGVALAVLIGRWAWRLGGAAAAVAATYIYCLDPNFLGHAPLVKNDVAFALAYFAAAYALWCLGRRFTVTSAIALTLLTATAVAVKLSGVLLAPVLIIALAARAGMKQPWMIFGRPVTRRGVKFAAAFGLCVAAAVVTYAGIWASYGFRFDAGPNGMRMDTAYYVETLRRFEVYTKDHGHPTQTDYDAWQMPLSTRAILFLEDHRLMPQAWTSGFVLTQTGDLNRGAYLFGKGYIGGRWYYFPLAALFKSPLATTAAVLLAAIMGRRAIKKGLLKPPENRWTAIAMGTAAGVYAVAMLTTNLNIGLRHAFPLFPFAFVGVGLAAKKAWEAGSPKPGEASRGRIAVLALGAALAAETAAAFPNYIAFFNVACASQRLWLLSDSNLDWGQDLPLLMDWQKRNPDVTLYLNYFGLCDPAAYGIHYVNVPPGYLFGPPPVWPTRPGVVAISATFLQQVYTNHPEKDIATLFQDRRPEEILGNTIYLFKFDPAEILGSKPRSP
jgi:hypothetical protein